MNERYDQNFQEGDKHMSRKIEVTVHSVKEDGLPDMDALSGRVALIFDGCVVSGWPLRDIPGSPRDTGRWEGNTDVAHKRHFLGVTHWLEFPEPLHQIEGGRG